MLALHHPTFPHLSENPHRHGVLCQHLVGTESLYYPHQLNRIQALLWLLFGFLVRELREVVAG